MSSVGELTLSIGIISHELGSLTEKAAFFRRIFIIGQNSLLNRTRLVPMDARSLDIEVASPGCV